MSEDTSEKKLVNPSYYMGKTLSAGDVINDFELNFWLGSAVKYVLRAGKKSDDAIKDLEKAKNCIAKEIESRYGVPVVEECSDGKCCKCTCGKSNAELRVTHKLAVVAPESLDLSSWPHLRYHGMLFDVMTVLGDHMNGNEKALGHIDHVYYSVSKGDDDLVLEVSTDTGMLRYFNLIVHNSEDPIPDRLYTTKFVDAERISDAFGPIGIQVFD